MSDSVGRNSLIMAAGTAASRVTGQLRTILLAAAVGTTGLAANAYQAGSMIPQVIYTLVSGGIFNAVLVPHIVRTMKSRDAKEQLDKLVTFAVCLLLGVTVIMAVAAPLVTRLYVAGSPELVALSYAFTLWCTPQIFFYGLYTVLGQILAVQNRFGAYAWSSVGANVISCAGFATFIALFGDMSDSTFAQWDSSKIALTAGTWTLGVAFQALVLFIPLMRSGIRIRPRFGVRGIGLRTMGPIAAWSLGIVLMDQVANVVSTRVLTSAPMKAQMAGITGIVAGNATYQNAYTIYILPYSLIAVSVATAIFPRISAAIAERDMEGARGALSSALRNVGLIMGFFTAAFIAMPTAIVGSLLPTVPAEQVSFIASTLITLSVCLPLSSAYLIIQRTFYAFEDGRSPFTFMAILYVLEMVFIGLGTLVFAPTNWCDLVGASLSLAYVISFVPLVFMLRRKFAGSLDGRRIARTYGKAVLAALASIIVGVLLSGPVGSLTDFGDGHGWAVNWAGHVITAAVIGIVMLAVYVGVLWLAHTEELTGLVATLRARLSRQPAVAEGVPADELEMAATAMPSQQEEAPIALPEEPAPPSFPPTTAADRMATATPVPPAYEPRTTPMKPHLGDTVLNRYTLVSPLREEAGLQAWKANDRVLARDCQLFIVNNKAMLRSTNAIAGTLAASRDPRFTPVIQLQHDGPIAVVLTQLDGGVSITEYLHTGNAVPLGHEAMRTIIGEAGQAMRFLHREHLTHHALSTDTIRLTKSGVQVADAPVSQALADTSMGAAGDNDERRAVRQLAAVLYCMLTRTASTMRPTFDLSALPADTPAEFRVIVKRGLDLSEDGKATVPLLTLAELEALLGPYKPLHALGRQELRLGNQDGACSIVRAMIQPALPGDILPIPETLLSQQTMPAFQFATAAPAPDAASDEFGQAEDGTGEKTGAENNTSLKELWNRSKTIMAEGAATGAGPEIMPEDATEMFSAFAPGADYATDTLVSGMLMPSDVTRLTASSPEDTTGSSTTGQLPAVDRTGHAVPQVPESQRALEQEKRDIDETYVMGTPALPPSFAPRSQEGAQRPSTPKAFDDTEAKGASKTRRVALIVCIIAVVAALVVAVTSVAKTGSLFNFGKQDTTYWPKIDANSVPFGSRTGEDVESPTNDATPKATATPSETKKPENTTPYPIESANFLDRPNGAQGYGYAIHLKQKENVSKVIIKIQSSGGRGYIRVNTTGDPNAGEQVADFTFAEGGTTEVKLDKAVDTQDLMLWVPLDSMPGNQLYINSVEVL
ncbi:murein biosynthesis integral membrane protein MurJ [Bifidobacterium cuniculi]|uniref:Integral membrane protein MviN n=1 Tax=Bifidobacterium cuniculi TaxID=1688 RepID=A0A087ANB3_9BIFI|nr:murein biosynthesis integral membrane protein MurJ [Bifidobacterium cuniculi]KFI60263.1 integral membrane protein MviN [Bifidobacterium cuniculi]